jgi:N-methylhydantoinase B
MGASGGPGTPHNDGWINYGLPVVAGLMYRDSVEIDEQKYPIIYRTIRLVPDSGGAGRFRGGVGSVLELRVRTAAPAVANTAGDGVRHAPYGLLGGRDGAVHRYRLVSRGRTRVLRTKEVGIPVQPGDVFLIESSGGGGYGPPWERDAELVAGDVRGGFVSPASARERYGVVIEDGHVDLPATEALRAEMRGRNDGAHFDLGAGRREYEAIMTRERYDALARILDATPVLWRFWLKHRILDALLKDGRALPEGPAAITRAYASLRQRLPELREIEPA